MNGSRVALAVAAFAAALLLASGPGARFGLWPFQTGFTLLRWAVYLALAAIALALGGAFVATVRAGQAGALAAAFVVAAGVVAVPAYWLYLARSVPPIHDISTDLDDPPAFVAVVPLRADAPNPVEHGGAAVADAQRQGYPDLAPLRVAAAPAEAFAWALEAARAMGWEIVAHDAAAGRIEATDTTFWFGFRDDVVIRVGADGPGTRIDVRSKSRVGRSDVGTNAKRIRAYLGRVAAVAAAARS
jgi:uncharacterized protein (DUF1499 family)